MLTNIWQNRARKEKGERKQNLTNMGNEKEDLITVLKKKKKIYIYNYIPVNLKIYMIWKIFQKNNLSKIYQRRNLKI